MTTTTWRVSRRAALATLAIGMSACASNPTQIAQSGNSIDEGMFVEIGGVEQWVTINGNDRANPVVLFLHPGPGVTLSPYATDLYAGWEQDFTLVQWDQRGAGRTYGRNPPSGPTSIERMVKDGLELAAYLTQHLDTPKIFLVGASWGTILGTHMAHQRPDLFYAYLGQSQVVTLIDPQGDADKYNRGLAAARAAEDQYAIDEMTRSGPPWQSGKQWRDFQTVAGPYQLERMTVKEFPLKASPEYSTPKDMADSEAGLMYSLDNFFGIDELGPLFQFDLAKEVTKFEIPVFLIEGEEDGITSPITARAYFDVIEAQKKEFFLIPGAGHAASAPQLELTRKLLLKEAGELGLRH